MLKIDLSRQAEKFLKQITPKHGKQVAKKLMELRVDPRPPDSWPLKGEYSTYRRADVGEYRIIHRVDGDILRAVVIGKRNDDEVYRMLRRR